MTRNANSDVSRILTYWIIDSVNGVSRIMAYQRCLNHQNLWQSYHIRIKDVDGIKVANQLTLKWRDYPGLSGWSQCDYNNSPKWTGQQEGQS